MTARMRGAVYGADGQLVDQAVVDAEGVFEHPLQVPAGGCAAILCCALDGAGPEVFHCRRSPFPFKSRTLP